MPQWSKDQHFNYMARSGVTFRPRHGDGTSGNPWREADASAPFRDGRREHAAFERYLASLPAGHVAMLEALNSALPPLSPDCRLIVLLPCRNEAQHIEAMLGLLANQYGLDGRPLPREAYEVIVLSNHMEGERVDNTERLARSWRHSLGMVCHVVDYTHPAGETSPLTMARKILTDLAIVRAVQRGPAAEPLYLASEDADILWLDPHQLALMIARLDRDAGLDGLRGQQDRCPWIMVRHPLLLLMRRSWNFTESAMARRSLRPDRNPGYDFNWNRIVASGWNTVFSAEVYVLIGGYTRERRFGEDMDIGEKISCLRATETPSGLLPQVNTFARLTTRTEGSPRRWLYRISADIEPYLDTDNYANFFDPAHEREVKFQSLEVFDRRLAQQTALETCNLPLLTSMLQVDLDFLVDMRKDPIVGAREYRRILGWLGFGLDDYAIADGRLEIRSLDHVGQRLAAHTARWPAQPVPPVRQIGAPYRRSWHGPPIPRGGEPFRVGLVGCGRIAEEGQLLAYRSLPPGIEIAALHDPNAEWRDRLGEWTGVPPDARHATVDALLEGGTLNAAVITSPSAHHSGAIERCLYHGVAVICETPLAATLAEIRRLRDLADTLGVPLGTVRNHAGSRLWQRGLEIVRTGILGKPVALRSRILSDGAPNGFSGDEMCNRREIADRGRLLDQGYHLFYLSPAVFGSPIETVGGRLASRGSAGRDVDDSAEMVIRHACGGETAFTIDWCHPAVEPTIYEIDCTAGQAVLDVDRNEIAVQPDDGEPWTETLGQEHGQGFAASLGENLRRLSLGMPPLTPADAEITALTWIEHAYAHLSDG